MNNKIIALIVVLSIIGVSGCTSDSSTQTFSNTYLSFNYPSGSTTSEIGNGSSVQVQTKDGNLLVVTRYETAKDQVTAMDGASEETEGNKLSTEIDGTKYVFYSKNGIPGFLMYFFEKNGKYFSVLSRTGGPVQDIAKTVQ